MNSFGRISEKDITDFEKQEKITLPESYRQFLLKNNGGQVNPEYFPIQNNPSSKKGILDWFYGLKAGKDSSYDLSDNRLTYLGRMPANLLPIACDPGGNQICLSLEGGDTGKVYFWDHEEETEPPAYGNVYLIANSFNAFLASLHEK